MRVALPLALTMLLAQGLSPAVDASAWTGFDVSWPNCGVALPDGARFGIIGITGGHAFSTNPCLRTEYALARHSGVVRLYINLNMPHGATAKYGARGPAGRCALMSALCRAYNYGYMAARAAWVYAVRQLGHAAVRTSWWLDVEVLNRWSTSTAVHDRVIQGALDFLGPRGRYGASSKGYRVGIYSTNYQWRVVAGAYYKPRVAVWYATVEGSAALATSRCAWASSSYGFTGGPVRVVQFRPTSSRLDADYACYTSI